MEMDRVAKAASVFRIIKSTFRNSGTNYTKSNIFQVLVNYTRDWTHLRQLLVIYSRTY